MLPQTFWRQLEGTVLDGRVRVGELLRGDRESTFAAEPVDESQFGGDLCVRFMRATSEPVLERYLEASFLAHRNLLRVFATGSLEFAGTPLLYAVLERAEETLADIESHGPLTADDARDLGLELISALEYLHQRNFVYCNLDPTTVVRAGDTWKLADYSQLRLAGNGYGGETRRMLALSAGTPPEAWDGIVSPAWDAWSLAWLLAGAISERKPGVREPAGARTPSRRPLPEPFAGLITECLNANPAERCGLSRIAELLGKTAAPPPPVVTEETEERPRAEAMPVPLPPRRRRLEDEYDEDQQRPWFRRLNPRQALATAAAFVGGFIVVATLAYHPNVDQQAPSGARPAAKAPNGEADRTVTQPAAVTQAAAAHDPELLGVLQKWTHASRTRNLDEQVACYAPVVDTFYGARGVSQSYIRRQRARALSKVGDVEKFDIDNVRVQMNGPEAATLTFDKTWAFGGRSHYSGKVREQMVMRRMNGHWRITSERDLHVYRGPTNTPLTAQS